MVLEHFPDDALLQAIAAENNLAETAFLVPEASSYRLRWFTPRVEVPLCGRATLASAAVVMERLEPNRTEVIFASVSGPLKASADRFGYSMDFPLRPTQSVCPPGQLADALGAAAVEVVADPFNYLVVLKDESTVRALDPDIAAIARLDRAGVIVSARGEGPYDFVSRYFTPAQRVSGGSGDEAARILRVGAVLGEKNSGKTSFRAYQASRRSGEVCCRLVGERVELSGTCVFYLGGQAEI